MQRLTSSITACVSALLLILAAGCVSNSYELELIPGEDGVERKLKATQHGANNKKDNPRTIDRDEVDQILAEYEDAKDFASPDNQHFSGKFSNKMPRDIGGSGRFAKWTTSLGTYHVYNERFRGDDDLTGELDARRKAGDRLMDLLADFVKQQTIDVEGQDRLLKLIDGDLRHDLHNLAVYVMSLQITAGQSKEPTRAEEWAMRLIQYCIERRYLVPSDTPFLMRAIRSGNQNDGVQVMSFVQRVLARKLGVEDEQPIPVVLDFLGEPRQLLADFNAHMRKTEEYFAALQEWNKRDDDSEQPTGTSVAGSLLVKATASAIDLGANDDLKLKLATKVQPFATNGEWDGAKERVKWRRKLERRDAQGWQWPVLCFAHWSIPDHKEQVAKFGSVVLRDQELAEYCLWYHGLSEQEVKEWDDELDRLKPTNWQGSVKGFRFSARTEASGELAAVIRKLLTKSEE